MKDNVIGGGSGIVGTSGVDGAAVSVSAVVVSGCGQWMATHPNMSGVLRLPDDPEFVFTCEPSFGCSCSNNLNMRGGK